MFNVIWPLALIGGLGLSLLLTWIWLRRNRTKPTLRVQVAFWLGEIALGILSLWFSWRFRTPMYAMIFAALILPLLRLWHNTTVSSSTMPAPRTGRISVLQTPWIILRLEHDSGVCSGQMLRGALRDWQLHEMDRDDLLKTRAEMMAHDPIGIALLDLWLDHHGAIHWRKDFGVPPSPAATTPTLPVVERDEGLAMLGLDAGAAVPEINAAAQNLQRILTKTPHHDFIVAWIAAARTACVA
jgi:hypothetical protein